MNEERLGPRLWNYGIKVQSLGFVARTGFPCPQKCVCDCKANVITANKPVLIREGGFGGGGVVGHMLVKVNILPCATILLHYVRCPIALGNFLDQFRSAD